MGYTTQFNADNNSDEVLEAMAKQAEWPSITRGYFEGKWYEWETDMKIVSQSFPNTILYLSGGGEENEDIWEARFLNGKSEIKKAEIVIPPFTEII